MTVYDPRPFLEDVQWLTDTRETFPRAAQRLGVSRQVLAQRLRRAGRTDLLGRLVGYQEWVTDRQRQSRGAA